VWQISPGQSHPSVILRRIMQLLARGTAKRLNIVAQGRREAAHPGTRTTTIVYAEGVTQPIVDVALFNAFGVTIRSCSPTQGARLRRDPGLRCATPTAFVMTALA
jgi:hypothetical protein